MINDAYSRRVVRSSILFRNISKYIGRKNSVHTTFETLFNLIMFWCNWYMYSKTGCSWNAGHFGGCHWDCYRHNNNSWLTDQNKEQINTASLFSLTYTNATYDPPFPEETVLPYTSATYDLSPRRTCSHQDSSGMYKNSKLHVHNC